MSFGLRLGDVGFSDSLGNHLKVGSEHSLNAKDIKVIRLIELLLELIRVTDSLSHDSPLKVDMIFTIKGVGNSQAVSESMMISG